MSWCIAYRSVTTIPISFVFSITHKLPFFFSRYIHKKAVQISIKHQMCENHIRLRTCCDKNAIEHMWIDEMRSGRAFCVELFSNVFIFLVYHHVCSHSIYYSHSFCRLVYSVFMRTNWMKIKNANRRVMKTNINQSIENIADGECAIFVHFLSVLVFFFLLCLYLDNSMEKMCFENKRQFIFQSNSILFAYILKRWLKYCNWF